MTTGRRFDNLLAGVACAAGALLLADLSPGPAIAAPGDVESAAVSRPVASRPSAAEPRLRETTSDGWTLYRDSAAGPVRFAVRTPRGADSGGVPLAAGGALTAGSAGSFAAAEAAARSALRSWAPALGLRNDLSDLVFSYERRGLSRRVLAFEQRRDGIPVLGGVVSVTLRGEEPILIASGYLASRAEEAAAARPADAIVIDGEDAVARVRAALAAGEGSSGASKPAARESSAAANAASSGAAGEFLAPPSAAAVWYPDAGGALARGWLVRMRVSDRIGDWRAVVGAGGEIVSLEDDARYAEAAARVFQPNPVVTLGTTSLSDLNDADQGIFSGAYLDVTLLDLTFEEGLYRLEGPNVRIDDFEAPDIAPPANEEPEFLYNRADDRFEAVMAYYHIDRAQRYLQGLGFDDVAHFAIEVDAHGVDGQDQSYYLTSSKQLAFGDGCVDDAEDADVLYHEYGHAIQDNQVPGWGIGAEALALGEGFGDYWAASLSEPPGGGFDDEQVFDWDRNPGGGGCGWPGRRVDSPNTMAQFQNSTGPRHANGMIWSAALWDIREAIGPTIADRLVIEAHFGLVPATTYDQNATSLARADVDLYGGVHLPTIVGLFAARLIEVDTTAVLPDTTSPRLALGVFQNPVLSAYVDFVLVGNEALLTESVAGELNGGALPFAPQGGTSELFRAEKKLATSGDLTIRVAASDFAGNASQVERVFGAEVIAAALPARVLVPGGALEVRIPAGALPAGTWILAGRGDAAGGDAGGGAGATYFVGPAARSLAAPAEIFLRPQPGGAGLEGASLTLNGDPIPAWWDAARGALAARLPALGEIAVRAADPPAPGSAALSLRLDPPWPNPATAGTRILLRAPHAERATIAVYAVTGERVRDLFDGRVGAGPISVAWDGRDAHGRAVPSGVYLFRAEGESGSSSRKVVIAR